MAEYWKSTPTYWCKFCTTYIRDTPLERKNHEASGKHQNNIQRSLRELHKKNDRAERDALVAKREVARLNSLVGGEKAGGGAVRVEGLKDLGSAGVGAGAAPNLTAAQQRKAHAEQLLALGVAIPDELKREVTGVGGWETVSETVVDDGRESQGRSLADIVKEEKVKSEGVGGDAVLNKGVRKRKVGEEEEEEEREEAKVRKKAWGSRIKEYPGASVADGVGEDLESLLSGVTAKRKVKDEDGPVVENVKNEKDDLIKKEERADAEDGEETAAPDADDAAPIPLKREESNPEIDAPPVVFFKKRKAKK